MTPGHPWRRRWHDTLHPLLWWVLFIILMFVAVDASIARADAPPATGHALVAVQKDFGPVL